MAYTPPIGNQTQCQICQHSPLTPILSLGHHSPVHAHLNKEGLHKPETTYPLNLCRCSNCGLPQLDYICDPKIIFPPEYPYKTGLTNMLIKNFRALAELLMEKYQINSGDLIIDIGSNDGTLLQGFKEKGMKVLGIEPTNMAKIANQNGIDTVQEYFTKQVALETVAKHGKAKIITLANAFAHINNLFEILEGIDIMLAPNGVFISESQYFLDAFEKTAFDTIYHEHLRFYLLKPLQKLFTLAGFSLVDAEKISAAGGSIRVYAMKGKYPMSERTQKLIQAEEKSGVYDRDKLNIFAQKAVKIKHELLSLLTNLKKQNARIVAIGAPARGSSFLNFTKIDNHLIDYACEKNGSPKIGLYTPGTHIPIVDEEKMLQEQPEYALVLSWHIGEELMKLTRKFGYKGKFIIPLPAPHIVNNI